MPNTNLRVAALPVDITPFQKETNLSRTERELTMLEGELDLVVLPELFTTGFISDPELAGSESETLTGPTVRLIHQWAERGGYAVCGSFLAHTAHGIYNRAFFIEPSGDETFYDKRHLFTMGGEDKLLRRGDNPEVPVIRFRGWNIALAVCYDLRFPVWMRNTGLKYDLLVIPANWPESRAHAWLTLLNARAIENQAYVIGVDRLGGEGRELYPHAMTQIYDHMGRVISERDESAPVYATLDAKRLTSDRERFPVWRDADRFTMN